MSNLKFSTGRFVYYSNTSTSKGVFFFMYSTECVPFSIEYSIYTTTYDAVVEEERFKFQEEVVPVIELNIYLF